MKKSMLAMVMTLMVTSSCLPVVSYAEGRDPHPDQQWQQKSGHGGHEGHAERGRQAPQAFHSRERDHFAWNGHDFRRGHPVPVRYRDTHYRVSDWRARGLYEPPAGDYWSYINGNYVLVAAATGVIATILIDSALQH